MKRRMHPPLLYVKCFICVLSGGFISSVISIAGIAMLAAPMATVQANIPVLDSLEITTDTPDPRVTGDSLYNAARIALLADWNNRAGQPLLDAQTGNVLTAPGYSTSTSIPTTDRTVKFFTTGDNIHFKLTFGDDVTVTNPDSNKPYLVLRLDQDLRTDLLAVYNETMTTAELDNKVVYFTYTVQDGDDVFGDLRFAQIPNVPPYNLPDANNHIKRTHQGGQAWAGAELVNKLGLFYNKADVNTYDYLIDTIRANVRIPGLIKAETHDEMGFRTAHVDFSTTDPDAAVTEPDTQTESFDVEFLFYNYGIGGGDDGVIADTTRGFEATDITLKVDDTAVTLGSTAADWQVSAPMLIGLDHRDPGFPPMKDDNGQVKHSSAFKVYRATITPPSAFDGNVEITVPENATMDIAGNLSLASNTLTVPVNTSVEVTIPDETLRAKIKETLNIAAGTAVTSVHMLDLTSLDLGGSDVSKLTGLEYATNLEELDLGGTQVSDVSPLANLTNLRVLDLSDTQVSDISPLSD